MGVADWSAAESVAMARYSSRHRREVAGQRRAKMDFPAPDPPTRTISEPGSKVGFTGSFRR